MRGAAVCAVAVAFALCTGAAQTGLAEPTPGDRRSPPETYRARLSEDWSRLRVEACFDEPVPDRLYAGSGNAHKFLISPGIRHGANTYVAASGEQSIAIDVRADTGCLGYTVAIRAAANAAQMRGRLTDDRTMLISPGLWLWRPDRLPDDALLRFELPIGVSVSAPWPLLERRGAITRYRLVDTPTQWPARMAFGEFQVREFDVGGARLRLAVVGSSPRADDFAVSAWLDEAVRAVTTLYGRFPSPDTQLLVVPIGSQAEPVPWGEVLRGGNPAVHLFIDQTRPSSEWSHDWTAVHELSHVLLPYISRRDAWLSEGFASYYQNVLRARAGLISEADAWRKLVAGFERGRQDTRPGVSLTQASREMRREHAFMRVYWSGAAIALVGDMQLRQLSDELSLDVALSRLASCCLPSQRMWTAAEAVAKLDELTGQHVLSALYAHWRGSDRFPDVSVLLENLGVIGQGSSLSLDDTAPLAPLRRALMAAPTSPKSRR